MLAMRPVRWIAVGLKLLLLVTLVTTGAHTHAHDAADHPCVVCAVGHAPAVVAAASPAPQAPEPTLEILVERPASLAPSPSCAIPSSRAPPLG
ncbi:MAG: hypothetical protein ABI960_08755 [Candidatus Eisenbacteria bacterium]